MIDGPIEPRYRDDRSGEFHMLSLLPGERILWEGHPATGPMFQLMDIFLIPFSLLWTGFAFTMPILSWKDDSGPPVLFFLPFLIAGIYITVGRFILDMWLRRRITYLVTNKRVILRKEYRRSVRSLDIRRLPMIDLDERTDGSGTINFERARRSWFDNNNNMGSLSPAMTRDFCFLRIANARATYNLIVKQADLPG